MPCHHLVMWQKMVNSSHVTNIDVFRSAYLLIGPKGVSYIQVIQVLSEYSKTSIRPCTICKTSGGPFTYVCTRNRNIRPLIVVTQIIN